MIFYILEMRNELICGQSRMCQHRRLLVNMLEKPFLDVAVRIVASSGYRQSLRKPRATLVTPVS
jgi:hypothetical protein